MCVCVRARVCVCVCVCVCVSIVKGAESREQEDAPLVPLSVLSAITVILKHNGN